MGIPSQSIQAVTPPPSCAVCWPSPSPTRMQTPRGAAPGLACTDHLEITHQRASYEVFFAARGLSGLSPADGWRAGPGTPGAAPGYPIGISVAAISMAAINKYLARRNRSRMRAKATNQRDASSKAQERQQEPRLFTLSC